MKLVWTPTSLNTYFDIIDYLEKEWSKKEIHRFIRTVDSLLAQISTNPESFPSSSKIKNVRKVVISKHNTLYYKVRPRKEELVLLLFWDNRRNPKKLQY